MAQWVTAGVGSRLFGKTRQAIDLARKGKKISHRVKNGKNEYRVDELREYFSRNDPSIVCPDVRPARPVVATTQPVADVDQPATDAQPILDQPVTPVLPAVPLQPGMTEHEAKRVYKIEQARKLRRENDEREGKLLERTEITAAFGEMLGAVYTEMMTVLDVEGVSLAIDPATLARLSEKMRGVIGAAWARVREKYEVQQ